MLFAYKGTGDELIGLLEEKVDSEQGSFLNFKRNDFYGVAKKEKIHLILNKGALWGTKVFCFDGKVTDVSEGAVLYLKYRMRLFFRIFVLLWFNVIFLFIASFAMITAWLFLMYLFSHSPELVATSRSQIIDYGLMFLGTIFLSLFGFLIIRLMKFFENRNKVILNQFLLALGCIPKPSATLTAQADY